MKAFISFVLLILLIAITDCATEQKVQTTYLSQENCSAPVLYVGDAWKFQNEDKRTWEIRVIQIEDKLYIIENPAVNDHFAYDKKTLGLKFHINNKGERSKPRVTEIFYDFPIFIGKKWSEMITSPPARGESIDFNYLLQFKCVSYEDVSVPAGSFKAFKIKYKQTNMHRGASGEAYIWYSPEVKMPIKMTYEKTMYWTGRQDWALASYKLKGQ